MNGNQFSTGFPGAETPQAARVTYKPLSSADLAQKRLENSLQKHRDFNKAMAAKREEIIYGIKK